MANFPYGFDNLNDNTYHYVMDRPPLLQVSPTYPDRDGKRISSETLFGERREVVILHNGREYRLRLTQNDKMILTA